MGPENSSGPFVAYIDGQPVEIRGPLPEFTIEDISEDARTAKKALEVWEDICITMEVGGDALRSFFDKKELCIGNHTVNVLNTKYKNRIKVVQEAVLNILAAGAACPWFMASDPRLVKSVQVDYLNGTTAPSFRRSEKAGYLGYLWDIWLDWGINAADFRGILRNNGVPMGQ